MNGRTRYTRVLDVHEDQYDIGSFFLTLGPQAIEEYEALAQADRKYGEDIDRELRDRAATRRS